MHFLCKHLYCCPHNLLTLDMANFRSCSVTHKWLQRCISSSWLLPAVIFATELSSHLQHCDIPTQAEPAPALKWGMHCLFCLHPLHCDPSLHIAFIISGLYVSQLFRLNSCMIWDTKTNKGVCVWGNQTPSSKASYASVFMLTNKDGRNQRCLETFEVTFSSLPVSKYYILLWEQQAEDDF